jgi:hypothetical protein
VHLAVVVCEKCSAASPRPAQSHPQAYSYVCTGGLTFILMSVLQLHASTWPACLTGIMLSSSHRRTPGWNHGVLPPELRFRILWSSCIQHRLRSGAADDLGSRLNKTGPGDLSRIKTFVCLISSWFPILYEPSERVLGSFIALYLLNFLSFTVVVSRGPTTQYSTHDRLATISSQEWAVLARSSRILQGISRRCA